MKKLSFLFCLTLSLIFFLPSQAPAKMRKVRCTMTFNLKSWSVFYKSGKGEGEITCSNGQKASVEIKAKGGGISFGKRNVKDGHGKFSPVNDIEELFGFYSQAEAHAGAAKSAQAQTMSKDGIDLDLRGHGSGVDIGFDFGSFKLIQKK